MTSRLFGDWQRATDFFARLLGFSDKIERLLEDDIAKEVEVKLKENVRNQLLDLKDLSPEYLARKRKEGLDTRTLIATGDYIESLRVFDIQKSKGKLTIYVGASNEDKHYSGLSVGELALIIEEGTFNIPPRPHFRLTWEKIDYEIRRKIELEVENIFNDMI